MRKLVYDVAVSADGFIAGENDDVGAFLYEGAHVTDYLERLAAYDTAVMGRATYEFGYAHGMRPGERPYPHMRHYVFSRGLELPGDEVTVVRSETLRTIDALKAEDGGDIYLTGGGVFAGALLRAGRIDRLVLKLNPILIGKGVPLFGPDDAAAGLTLTDTRRYDTGVVLLTYDLPSVRVRAARADEIGLVREIERASAQRFNGTDRESLAEDEPTAAEVLAQRLADGGLLVAAEGDGQAAAFVMFRELEGCAYVEQIDVLPSHEGRRLGALLLEAVADAARRRGWRAMTLSTFRDVPFNAPYYRRLGFVDLPDETLSEGLREVRREHIARGLDESSRTFMRRLL